jgi:carbon monoxide dehydrogenase subunit G
MPTLIETFPVSDTDHVWGVINDLNTLVPCVPGARVASSEGPESVRAEITVRMGAMGMLFSGPVTLESSDVASRTIKVKAMTREAGGQSRASGDITISLADGVGTINAVALINGKAAMHGEGTMMGVLIQLAKGFSTNVGNA